MALSEISFIIDWGVWIPVAIAATSLILTFYSMRKRSTRADIAELEKKIDRARETLKECEDNLNHCGHEKDELRREKFALLEQIAAITKPRPPEDNNGGSDR
jgi:septal ring factor EnvC (AmiA/AmiB activator)